MPKHFRANEAEDRTGHYVKKQKIDNDAALDASNIASARDIHALLAFTQNNRELKIGLKKFKLFLESILYPGDETKNTRAENYLKEYLDSQKPNQSSDGDSTFLADVIQTWEYAGQTNDDSLFTHTVAVIALLLKTLSSRIHFRDHGLAICRSVLQQNLCRLLSRGLSSPKHKDGIISPCLKLLTEMVYFDGGTMGHQIYNKRDQFFDPSIISRNLGIGRNEAEVEVSEQRKLTVRTNTIRYVLANLKMQNEGVKMDILKHFNIARSLFRHLLEDSPGTIAQVLSTIDTYIMQDNRITWTSKAQFLTEQNLKDLCSLYQYDFPQHPDTEALPSVRELIHQFLKKVCTSTKHGILRYSSGWYPRTRRGDHAEEASHSQSEDVNDEAPEIYGKALRKLSVKNNDLAALAQHLRPFANNYERELLITIFKAAPELVADYWFKRATFSWDPLLTATWMGYSAFIFSAIQLPIPEYCGQRNGYATEPPPISIVLENILPLPLNQKNMTRSLSVSSTLIKTFGINVLSTALQKLKDVVNLFKSADAKSGSNKWSKVIPELVAAFTRRCPKMEDVITAFRKVSKKSILHRQALTRVLCLYYEALPQAALEENLDISVALGESMQGLETKQEESSEHQLQLVELGHLLRIAEFSPHINWWRKPAKLKYTPFMTLLLLKAQSTISVPGNIGSLLETIATNEGILQSITKRSALNAMVESMKPTKKTEITDETYNFVDDCLQRYTRKQMIYEDQLLGFIAKTGADESASKPISVFVLTLYEQWSFVEKNRADDAINIATWLASFITKLIACGEDAEFLTALMTKMQESSIDKSIGKKFSKAISRAPSGLPDEDTSLETEQVNGVEEKLSIEEEAKESLDEFAPPITKNAPNFVKFKQGDILTILESSSLPDLILCLSSDDRPTRIQALSALQHFIIRLQTSTFPDREALYLLLGELVETSLEQSSDNSIPLPYLVTTFVAHAMPVLKEPTSLLYSKVCEFLMLKPHWKPHRLLRHFQNAIILAEPADDSENGPWVEISWLLNWLYDGLRTPKDCEILRQLGTWETIGALCTHPALGFSKARLETTETSTSSSKARNKVRQLVVQIIARSMFLGEGPILLTRFGGLAWLEAWEGIGLVESNLAKALKKQMLDTSSAEIADWTFGLKTAVSS